MRTEWGRRDWRGSDLPQIHPKPLNCQLPCDPPAGQTLNTAKRGLDLGHCREAEGHASKHFQKPYPHPHPGLVRPSKKCQGLKHVGRWVPQTHSIEARGHGAVATQCIIFTHSGASWVLTWHLPPLPLLPGGPREWRAWGGEAACNMPVAALAGTSLLAPGFFTLSAACALIFKGGNCNRDPGGPESLPDFVKCPRKQTPTTGASLSQTEQHSSSDTLSLPAPGASGTFPRRPLPATCADSLCEVAPLLLGDG